jgi:hypothetical protein
MSYIEPRNKTASQQQQPHYGAISRFLNDYFGRGDGLAGQLGLVFFIYVVMGVFWYSLFSFVISPTAILDFQNAVNGITFIVSTLYIRWIAKSWDGYSDGPRQLMDINARICQVFSTFTSLWIGREKVSKIKPGAASLSPSLKLGLASQVYLLLDAQVFYTMRMFIPDDTETYLGVEIEEASELVQEQQHHKESGGGGGGVMLRYLPRRKSVGNAFDYVLKRKEATFGENENLKLKELQEHLLQCLSMLEHLNVLSATHSSSLLAEITPLTQLYGEASKKSTIREPIYQEWHVNLILFIYFAFCTPVSYYTSAGAMIIYVYPILTFIFTAFFFIRSWLGNPFDPRNPMGVTDYYRWRVERREALSKNYSDLVAVLLSRLNE